MKPFTIKPIKTEKRTKEPSQKAKDAAKDLDGILAISTDGPAKKVKWKSMKNLPDFSALETSFDLTLQEPLKFKEK